VMMHKSITAFARSYITDICIHAPVFVKTFSDDTALHHSLNNQKNADVIKSRSEKSGQKTLKNNGT